MEQMVENKAEELKLIDPETIEEKLADVKGIDEINEEITNIIKMIHAP
jgi:hypothetical protein